MECFDYRKIADQDDDGIPYLVETAFGWLGDRCRTDRAPRLVTGVNWSPGIINPFRQLGSYGAEPRPRSSKSSASAATSRSIFVLHVACPRVEYLDRAKSAVVVSS